MTPLVDYSSSDEEEQEDGPQASKAKNGTQSHLPSLPNAFRNLYSTNVRRSNVDDPSLYGGRKRQKPHVEGNWPTHVYTEWYPDRTQLAILSSLVSQFAQKSKIELYSLLASDLGAPLPLHISLSRSLQVPTDQKDLLLSKLRQSIGSLSIQPFVVNGTGLTWVANYDQTRYFLALKLSRPEGDDLNRLLMACNKVAFEEDYSLLYIQAHNLQDPATDLTSYFHFSLAWSLISAINLSAAQTMVDGVWDELVVSMSVNLEVKVMNVLVKIGNTVHSIQLGPKADSGGRAGILK